ncbi:MAG: indolepyruvate oxidoreductase subunit beta [Lachnospiraceae bacterium]|nr:indolepyruvate oxidoreductase subunit beta [Lachnospiraceae bacterium]
MYNSVLLSGVGGQGTVLASKLLSAAALKKGFRVLSAETIGMAQRGGSVVSHLKMGTGMSSPLIGLGCADLILGFEPGETVRALPYLKKGGAVVVSTRPVVPPSASRSAAPYDAAAMVEYLKKKVERLYIVDTDRALSDLGSPRVLNVVLLGTAVRSRILDITPDEVRAAIRAQVKPAYVELNLRALDYTAGR